MSIKRSHLSAVPKWIRLVAGAIRSNMAKFYVMVILGLGLFHHGWKSESKRSDQSFHLNAN